MKNAKAIALGGVLGALAVTVMFLGGLVPLSTYICPILCTLLVQTVLIFCGGRIATSWYFMVAFLCLLMGPDKEASSLFALIGYYPIIKPKIEKLPLPILWKLMLFNTVIVVMYTVMLAIFGFEPLLYEKNLIGYLTLGITVLLGNITFFLTDKLLDRYAFKKRRR